MTEFNLSANTILTGQIHAAIDAAQGGSWRSAVVVLPVTVKHGQS